jgi:hypothetical protein
MILVPTARVSLSYFCLPSAQDSEASILFSHPYGGCAGKATMVKTTVVNTLCRRIVQPLTTFFIGTSHWTYTYLLLPMHMPLIVRLRGR